MAVSMSVSPLRMDDELVDMFITSAPRRLPASSNEAWVRVETSKKRLIWVRPRSEARFFSTWRLRSTNSSARSRRPEISACESPSIPNRCRLLRTNEGFGAMVIKARPIGATGLSGKGVTRRSTRHSSPSLMFSLSVRTAPPVQAIWSQLMAARFQSGVPATIRECVKYGARSRRITQEPRGLFQC